MNLRKLFLPVVICLIMSICTSTCVFAKEEKVPEVTIAVCADFKPFEYIDDNGNLAGIDIDIMNELCEIMGVKPKYTNMEFDELIPCVRSPLADFAISAITPSETRKKVVAFTDSYIDCRVYNPSLDRWYEETYAIAVKLSGEYKNELNEAIAQFTESKKLDEIVAKYGVVKDDDGVYRYELTEYFKNSTTKDYVVSDWAKSAVNDAISKHWTSSKDFDNDFTSKISREQFCEIAYNMLRDAIGVDTVNLAETSFSDTNNTKVLYLAQEGIISGKGNDIFAPNDTLTRAEAASILYRIGRHCGVSFTEYNGTPFADDAQIAQWAKANIYYVVSAQIMSGTGDGFAPLNPYTAEQAISTIQRLYNIIK